MAHAWLDSLSEDWPSQPGSDASPPPQLPPLNSNENSAVAHGTAPTSRLPLPMKTAPTANANDGSFTILSERSTNERNLPSSARKPSKLSNEIDAGPDSRYASRTFSASTTGSVVHNTVNHRSVSASPNKKGHTPEWKRRLVYGEVPYGEQQDLFQSAATGLENMFKPPPPPQEGSVVDDSRQHSGMPSSPPIYRPAEPTTPVYDDDDDEEGSVVHAVEGSPSPSPRKPREMTYKMVDESYDASSLDGYSTQGHSQQADSIAEESLPVRVASANGLAPPTDASRKTSGQSVVRNEDFSPIMLTKQVGNVGQVDFAPVEVPADQLKNRLEKLRINQMLLGLGGFLNTRRGGRSAEGSFRHRLLSPGMSGDTSDMLPEDSLQASTPKQFPTIRINEEGFGSHRFASETPPQLRAPFPSPEKQDTNPQSNGGSPLKLFGPYDTFTNQTLPTPHQPV
ncbi:conserved leucine-rich repeat protein [Verticillium alfalfae VaMs.102]|uniref:Conserved leucine-rich repeat protein n=1 Tax=Verticillium alfalfae (strain VaMs.102 / ATCC MYA-4576 / FGSC 10136) TaxID=526221 RepID=C9SJM8_VERA1|nr:conserved leucine-rich repeat protein [Verticillium alfalfae VaMs.102]EEY19642.1 conserved leucine-rich repeat protein [Verticillium alfalfae VaMs.102]